jgi:hypothetical protein
VSGMKSKTHTASDDLRPGVHAVGDAGGDEDDCAIILVRTAVVEQAAQRIVVVGSGTDDDVGGRAATWRWHGVTFRLGLCDPAKKNSGGRGSTRTPAEAKARVEMRLGRLYLLSGASLDGCEKRVVREMAVARRARDIGVSQHLPDGEEVNP